MFLVIFGAVFYGVNNIKTNKRVLNDQIKLKDLVFNLKIKEKNYLLKEDKKDENLVWNYVQKIHTHIENTPGTLEEDIGMPKDLQNSKITFNKYTRLVTLSKKLIEENRININKAKAASEKLREDALSDLTHSRGNFQERLQTLKDQIVLLDYVTQIKIKEKNFLLYRDEKDYNLILSILNKLKIHIENTPGSLEEDAGIPGFLENYKNGIIKLHSVFLKEKEYQQLMRKYSNNLISKANTLLKEANNWMNNAVSTMKMTIIIMFIISLIIIIVSLLFIKKYVISSINLLNSKIEELSSSEGDLTKRVEIKSNDEIGEIAKNINKFMDKLEEIILSLKKSSVLSQDITKEIEKDSELTSNSVKKQNDEIIKTKNFVDEISDNIEMTKTIVINSAKDIEETKKVFEDLILSLEQVGNSINEDSDKEMHIAENVTALADQTEQIKNIISIIKEIADQTNLLALNAAIEAARAGEYGRGFAVVADEVRNLAERTQKSATEIDSVIQMIIQSVEESKKEIENTAQKSQQIVKSTNNLIEKSNNTKVKLDSTLQVSKKAVDESIKINKDTIVLKKSTDELMQEAKVTQKVSENLIEVAEKLKNVNSEINNEVNKFRV